MATALSLACSGAGSREPAPPRVPSEAPARPDRDESAPACPGEPLGDIALPEVWTYNELPLQGGVAMTGTDANTLVAVHPGPDASEQLVRHVEHLTSRGWTLRQEDPQALEASLDIDGADLLIVRAEATGRCTRMELRFET